MEHIEEVDAQHKLGELLDQVAQGRELVITRAGKPVARLIAPAIKTEGEQAVENLLAMRADLAARGGLMSLAELLSYRDEGRR